MRDATVKVINPLGLHARAAAQLVRLSSTFKSAIMLRRLDSGASANAKSILSVLALAASVGTTLTIEADGEDEGEAIDAITEMFVQGFGEI